jgi:peptide/nickel transport system ATP-binding protein
MIYQEPMASLNPAMTVGRQLMEVPIIHQGASRRGGPRPRARGGPRRQAPRPRAHPRAYPHQLSGGPAAAHRDRHGADGPPALLILDEPTTALDVTVEAAVVQLVKELGRKYGTSMLFISHNLGLVLETCDRICVMYSARRWSAGAWSTCSTGCAIPTRRPCSAPSRSPARTRTHALSRAYRATFPCRTNVPPGCNFGPRCDYFQPGRCDAREVPMFEVEDGAARHDTRCLRFAEIDWDAPCLGRPEGEAAPGPSSCAWRPCASTTRSAAPSAAACAKFVKANETLSFEAREGGPWPSTRAGCGKSTIAKVLMGLETATSGNIMLFAENIQNTPSRSGTPPTPVSSVQMVFQNPFDHADPR